MALKRVTIILRDNRIFQGFLLPESEGKIALKLNSGYNMIFDKKEVKSIKTIEQLSEKKVKTESYNKNKSLKTISILHTGGTIASRVDYNTGGVSSQFKPEDLIRMYPELKEIANIESKLIQNMWSDDLRFKHFEILAKAIEKEIKKGVNGIIIGIGTDNLSVASAALSFIIENPPIPILLVGAQRSSDRGSSDAAVNLISAMKFITKTNYKGVAICMHGSSSDEYCLILPATKTKKLHTSRRDAFKPVNDSAIAKIGGDKITFLKQYKTEGKLSIMPKMEDKVGLIKITINMSSKQFEFFKGYKGLIIEGTGLGHTPGDVVDKYTKEHEKIINAIKKLTKSGCVVVMTSNCLYGRVNMNVYSKGNNLQEAGVIGNFNDMLAETAFVKLSWLLGNYKKEDVKRLMCENLRGEISETSSEEWISRNN